MNNNEKENDGSEMKSEFVVKITGPGLSLERPVPAERVHYIVNLLFQPASAMPAATPEQSQRLSQTTGLPTGEISPKMFMAEKRPKTDMQRVACLGYYLTHHRGIQFFKTRDLTDLNKEAAQPPMSNPAVAMMNATIQQYVAMAGGGSKQITARGDALVEALPNHEKVKEALEKHPLTGRKRNSAANKK